MKNSLISLLLFASVLKAEEPPTKPAPIEKRVLDPMIVHEVPISRNRVTSISFPEAIQALDGAFLTRDEKTPGLVQLAHTAGTPFFSVRSLREDSRTNLNVRFAEETYVLLLAEADNPQMSVIFEPRPKKVASSKRKTRVMTPALLLGLFDKAKAYPFLKEHHPDSLVDVLYRDYRQEKLVTHHGEVSIRVVEGFRFETQGTLVFRLSLRNAGEEDFHYREDRFRLSVGEWSLPQALADASGTIPAQSETTAYVAFTLTGDGKENHFSLENLFRVTVEERLDDPVEYDEGGSK